MTITTDGILNVDISGATINVNISGQSLNLVQAAAQTPTLYTGDVTFATTSGGTQLPDIPCSLYWSYTPHGAGSFLVGTTSSPPYIDGGAPYNTIATSIDSTLVKVLGNINGLRAMAINGPSSITYVAIG